MKIGELAKATATKVETVLFYEKAGLLLPLACTDANYRSYGPSHLQRLSFIRRARSTGQPEQKPTDGKGQQPLGVKILVVLPVHDVEAPEEIV